MTRTVAPVIAAVLALSGCAIVMGIAEDPTFRDEVDGSASGEAGASSSSSSGSDSSSSSSGGDAGKVIGVTCAEHPTAAFCNDFQGIMLTDPSDKWVGWANPAQMGSINAQLDYLQGFPPAKTQSAHFTANVSTTAAVYVLEAAANAPAQHAGLRLELDVNMAQFGPMEVPALWIGALVFTKGDPITAPTHEVAIDIAYDGHVRVPEIFNGSTVGTLAPINVVLTEGRWHHVAIDLVLPRGKITLFVDGSNVASGDLAQDVTDATYVETGILNCPKPCAAAGSPVDFYIDDVAVTYR